MMMPSIALPTGPYDWHPERISREVFGARLATLRAAMTRHGISHTIVHGNIFDHRALTWLTHVTPKLGPAYALVPASGPLRVLFSGGPGMKPSALKLTWVEDLAALRSIEGDAKRWLEETAKGSAVRLGLVEGEGMLRADWLAVQRAAGGSAAELDAELSDTLTAPSQEEAAAETGAEQLLALACETITSSAKPGTDLRAALVEMERIAFNNGAQDVRVRVSPKTGGAPTTPPDRTQPMQGPTIVVVAVRYNGAWAVRRFVVDARD